MAIERRYSTESDSPEASFSYRDSGDHSAGTYYYVRVWLKGEATLLDGRKSGKYIWSSPIWLK